jgi:hypothetical protein
VAAKLQGLISFITSVSVSQSAHFGQLDQTIVFPGAFGFYETSPRSLFTGEMEDKILHKKGRERRRSFSHSKSRGLDAHVSVIRSYLCLKSFLLVGLNGNC